MTYEPQGWKQSRFHPLYFQSGTRLAWFVDLETRRIVVYRSPGEPTRVLDESGVLDGEDVVPGFSVPVADVFRKLPARR